MVYGWNSNSYFSTISNLEKTSKPNEIKIWIEYSVESVFTRYILSNRSNSGNTATFWYETPNMLFEGITAEAMLLHEYFLYISHRTHTLRLCVLNQPIVERKRHEEQQITGVWRKKRIAYLLNTNCQLLQGGVHWVFNMIWRFPGKMYIDREILPEIEWSPFMP